LQNADFRFCAQIRSHFLLHQKANHHRYFEGYPCFSATPNRHTNDDIPWDIPTLSSPAFRVTFRYIPSFCQTNKRDTNYYLQPLKCKEPSLLSQIFILVYRKTL